MADISASTWNEVDEANTAVSPLGFADGNSPNKLAAKIRSMQGAIKRSNVEINAYYASTGTATAQVLTYAQAAPSYLKGKRIAFFPNATNTGACTLNINSLGAKSILRQDGSALIAGDIVSGQLLEVYYDGTNFRINGSSAATNANFTGTVTANAFVGNGAAVTNVNAAKISGIDLTGLVQVGRQVIAGNGLSGGGDLSSDRTLSIGTPTTITTSTTNSVGAGTHSHAMTLAASDISTALGYTPSMNGLPVGAMIMIYGNGTTVPPGFLLANGAQITSTYPQLRAFLLANGAPTVSGNPTIPDMGGYFPRGWRAGQTVDSGRVFGTVQQDAMQRIQGTYTTSRFAIPSSPSMYSGALKEGPTVIGQNGSGNASAAQANIELDSALVTRTAAETRPSNVTVTYWIKAYDTPVDTATLSAAQLVNDVAQATADILTKRPRGGRLSSSITLNGLSVVDIPLPSSVLTAADIVRRLTLQLRNLSVSASAQPIRLQLLESDGVTPVTVNYYGGVDAQAGGSTGGQAWPTSEALLDYSPTAGIAYDIVAEIISRFAANGMIKSQLNSGSGTVRGARATGHYTVTGTKIGGIRLFLASGTFTGGDAVMSWEYD